MDIEVSLSHLKTSDCRRMRSSLIDT